LYGDLIDNHELQIQGVVFGPQKISSLVLFATILYAVYRYIVSQQARRAVLEREIQSAREIQRVLIPETLPRLDGYAITSAYTPAQEVGGDFFQIVATSEDSGILAIGDVSGKGLKAAMNVSMIVGVIRSQAAQTTSPAEILNALNDCLHGRMDGGFATGIVLRLDRDGTATFANAGHLPPFLNGQEFELEPSLPLGLTSRAEYEYTESRLRLQLGDQLAFFTDGLLEARNQEGELYGFDRLRTLFASSPTAHEACEAAVNFGQDDDITVLTLTRLAAGEEASSHVVSRAIQDA
jgi:serine phosphatase RsbU (regulator of sigma subunit)